MTPTEKLEGIERTQYKWEKVGSNDLTQGMDEETIKLFAERIKAAEERMMRNVSDALFSGDIISSDYVYIPDPWYIRIKIKLRNKLWSFREWLSKKIYPWEDRYYDY